jgi:type VI secretion system ImpM family protein
MTLRLFGKLPAHGDFVARGCSAEERASLDAWLTASMDEAQRRFGSSFAERFDIAQPWVGTGPDAGGIIAASQDAAGRRYPLILLGLMAAEGLDDLVYSAIADRWDADRVLTAMTEAATGASGSVTRWTSLDGQDARDDAYPLDIVSAMLSSPAA